MLVSQAPLHLFVPTVCLIVSEQSNRLQRDWHQMQRGALFDVSWPRVDRVEGEDVSGPWLSHEQLKPSATPFRRKASRRLDGPLKLFDVWKLRRLVSEQNWPRKSCLSLTCALRWMFWRVLHAKNSWDRHVLQDAWIKDWLCDMLVMLYVLKTHFSLLGSSYA